MGAAVDEELNHTVKNTGTRRGGGEREERGRREGGERKVLA